MSLREKKTTPQRSGLTCYKLYYKLYRPFTSQRLLPGA